MAGASGSHERPQASSPAPVNPFRAVAGRPRPLRYWDAVGTQLGDNDREGSATELWRGIPKNFIPYPKMRQEFWEEGESDEEPEDIHSLRMALVPHRSDKNVVLNAVRRKPDDLQYAGGGLKGDRDVVLQAVRLDGNTLQYASEELQNDREVVLQAVQSDASALQHASEELQNDRDVVLQAVQQAGSALEYASEELQNDRDVVLQAVQSDGSALQYASEELLNDRDVVLEAVRHDGSALQYTSEELQNDKDVVLQAVQRDGLALLYASQELQSDKDLALLAARSMPSLSSLPLELELLWRRPSINRTIPSAIAVQGEEAPILTVDSLNLDHDADGAFRVHCKASLMSGTCLEFDFQGGSSRRLVLNDLAEKLVEEMAKHTEVEAAGQRVFINFQVLDAEDGESVPVTPWDGERPLTNFLARELQGLVAEAKKKEERQEPGLRRACSLPDLSRAW